MIFLPPHLAGKIRSAAKSKGGKGAADNCQMLQCRSKLRRSFPCGRLLASGTPDTARPAQ